ncbi:hypothetical protein PVAP13_3NG305800 [Panicum virgatum]|uniref:mitogen-activated protein kinase kinase kinase n=1 Tax=Panicum virgatum TaxID=38727 RepID=A0A8T0UGX1_PANVG|nr:hypothetical protein PVAP13_3NG305800 [Panicum virgatum]
MDATAARAAVASTVATVVLTHQLRKHSKRPGGVRATHIISILVLGLSVASIHYFTLHLDRLQGAGAILYPIVILITSLWSSYCYVTALSAEPSVVHWSQWKKGACIGRGAFGQVYLASNRLCGLFCAIKEIQIPDPDSKEQIKKLSSEINFLCQFSHPNIVQYYGSNLIGGILSIYMEYMSEGSIHRLLKDGPFNEDRIRHCTAQILSGLAYLHERKIAHRDIKGGNILVGPNDEVKLADFGLAKHISYEAAIHSDKGTPFWMAPEVITSKSSGSGYNLLADIWSLGCTVIEMATGEHPWHEHCRPGEPCHHPFAGMFRAATSDDTPEIPESLSEEGKDFLRKCLRRDPESRPTAAQLMDHAFVRDYFASVQGRSQPSSPPRSAPLRRRRGQIRI